uniref:Uncharacterized protein n=1 Tax=Anguilla anguilla TaxID=7936 RepID=A0A0E9SQE2_ANGAN
MQIPTTPTLGDSNANCVSPCGATSHSHHSILDLGAQPCTRVVT